ncbi:anti-sigma factor ChrR (cupin superfamily) [Geomicrobium halophilum]|uniref:Anti-sigma factor ChrR (Cupin superfamily) n=1 Tax=Geomicrobium halophilum TaxID=549000 RepID=A0A841PIA9_9BACL|nr:hypothetical protein [Geomicrobium halophilum]MBB6448617.1 anti-sigma factor ChrR (cupin superfamily) [Geomicrobium halophilum]
MSTDINASAEKVGLPDMAIDLEEIPWVPQSDRVWFKPVRFDLQSGKWINLLYVKPGGIVNRHRHTSARLHSPRSMRVLGK